MAKVIIDLRVELEVDQQELLCCENSLEYARDSRNDIADLCRADEYEIMNTKVIWDTPAPTEGGDK